MIFEWDPAKARRNLRKHKGSFHEAATIFGDPLAATYPDPDHSSSEDRFITVGLSRLHHILVIAHMDHDDRIRIINARRATKREQRDYEETK